MDRAGPNILLSEGSSLSARETVTALGLAGHRVEIVSADPHCLARFSRFVKRVHRAPLSGVDPDGYLSAVLDIVRRRRIDVLLPVHEQAYLFAAARLPAALGVALADFAAFEEIQGKAAFSTLLTRLDVPQPPTEIVRSASAFGAPRPFPFFVKSDFGTASTGVWRVGDEREQTALQRQLEEQRVFVDGVVVQAAACGPLERVQSVFDRGRLDALHVYRQIAEGPGGGDLLKESVDRPSVRGLVERIGAALAWHGALSFDYILEDGTPRFFDANPRLVEPMNAWLSGVDLAGALLAVSLGEAPPAQTDGRPGVRTQLGLMGLLDAARRGRLAVLREIGALTAASGRYENTSEELTPFGIDAWSAIPMGMVAAQMLLSPKTSPAISQRTVANYSLNAEAVRRVREWTRR